ncbi:hypothetical protein STVIR_0076 [Streptomyces viridochromogenes Tue57]|uniref:Uncharacterized protein n=1 Tax=Streptomyces viridochromogenes Tue57 TaxID=1160705 RepID=L8PS89_STRVR|nr:hypothetical protein STVIR_0076 [Streptomyces viridochromogenes Tue57]
MTGRVRRLNEHVLQERCVSSHRRADHEIIHGLECWSRMRFTATE